MKNSNQLFCILCNLFVQFTEKNAVKFLIYKRWRGLQNKKKMLETTDLIVITYIKRVPLGPECFPIDIELSLQNKPSFINNKSSIRGLLNAVFRFE